MSIKEIEDYVTKGYKTILLREPDQDGLINYVDMISNDFMSKEEFLEILKGSEEYKTRFENKPNVHGSNTVVYCMMGGNKLHEIKNYIPITLPYIDKFIYVDSGSTDGSIEFLRDLSSKNDNKIDVIVREWQDKFSYFRNFYMEYLRNQNYDGWVIVSDTDEYYPPETLSELKNLIRESNSGNAYNGIEFRCCDIIIDDNDRSKILSEYMSNYRKGLMFKFHRELHYEGEPHEAFAGIPIYWRKVDLIYKHVRSWRKMYERAVENFFISNSNRYSVKWSEFRVICTKNDMVRFVQFMERYKKGDLPKGVEDWIYDHRNDNEDGDSEVREMAKLYYDVLHPEKRP